MMMDVRVLSVLLESWFSLSLSDVSHSHEESLLRPSVMFYELLTGTEPVSGINTTLARTILRSWVFTLNGWRGLKRKALEVIVPPIKISLGVAAKGKF